LKKDFWLILNLAAAVGAHMPATQAAFEINAAHRRKETSKTFSPLFCEWRRQAHLDFTDDGRIELAPSGEAGLTGWSLFPSYAFEVRGGDDSLKVNGAEQSFDGDPEMPLLWYLRDILGLTGSEIWLRRWLCGACTVHVNGQATRSCVAAMRDTAGKEVTTVEGLEKNGLHPVQKAWMQINVPQCGYCQVGQIMQAAALLNSKKKPTDHDR